MEPAEDHLHGDKIIEVKADDEEQVSPRECAQPGLAPQAFDDGSRDTNFNPGSGFDGPVQAIAIQADGKILVGGAFTSFNAAATR